MRYQWKDLKKGMVIFRDRINDLYSDDQIAYFEVLEITGKEEISSSDNIKKEIIRTHVYVYVYGDKPQNDGKWADEFNAGQSSEDSMWLTNERWINAGWHAVQFLTEEEMKRRVIKYSFLLSS